MLLKIRRSQRVTQGLVGAKVLYMLDARVELCAEDLAAARRYGLMGQVVYNSAASRNALAKSDAHRESGSWKGLMTSLAYVTLAAMNLNITIGGLIRGTHVACKDLDELSGAEAAIMTACQNLWSYLAKARTFDGRDVLYDFASGEPVIIAPGPVARPPEPPPPLPAAAMASPDPSAPEVPEAPGPSAASGAVTEEAGQAAQTAAALNDKPQEAQAAGPTLTRLSDGTYSAQPPSAPVDLSESLARIVETFRRLTPLQQVGMVVTGIVILFLLIKML